jgi:hypothetical protein
MEHTNGGFGIAYNQAAEIAGLLIVTLGRAQRRRLKL